LANIFFSYSHKDEELRDRLETHLSMLKRQGLIEAWHDRRILAGDEFDRGISANLEAADVILLLVSPDFLASQYCLDVEMARAIERHDAGEARVIPVILRHCDWHPAPFGKLLAAPKDGKPIKAWQDIDEAFLDVAKQVRAALPAEHVFVKASSPPQQIQVSLPGQRSSNLRLKKKFTEADRDAFLHETFEYMAAYFENSLGELEARNQSIKTKYRRLDANRFTGVIYENGKAVARCKIVLGGMFGRGISFSCNDQASDGSSNENLSVEATDQGLYMEPLGFAAMARRENSHLSAEGAAEHYWSLLIEPLQR
jgi:hypothetical protein